MTHTRQRLLGLGATTLLLLIVLATPIVLISIGAAPWDTRLAEVRTLLTSPDDGRLALIATALVAWVAWAVMTASVLIEVIAQVRGLRVPTLPGLAIPQGAAGRLVAVAALLFVAAPTIIPVFPTPAAQASDAQQATTSQGLSVLSPAAKQDAPAEDQVTVPQQTQQATVDYTVKRGDSLWKIADQLLGDGARYIEIVSLNTEVLNGHPDFITSGTLLKVPAQSNEPEANHLSNLYVVQAGDTLSGIAETELGDPNRYPEIFEASRDTVQPDGAVLSDPDLIRPGWALSIPGTHTAHQKAPSRNSEAPITANPPVIVAPPVDTDTHHPTPGAPPALAPNADPQSDEVVALPKDLDEADLDETFSWLVPGLSGAGALLAGAVLLTLRAHRRTQLRYRRPGQTMAPPPPELSDIEKTAFVSGAPQIASIGQLDRLLRQLATTLEFEGRALPSLATVTLARDTATLQLGEAAALPSPWKRSGSKWTAPLATPIPDTDQIPPYPTLVSIGQDDHGQLVLANLEHFGTLALTGDRPAAEALARHIAAELALNPWSVLVEIDTVAIGSELTPLDPMRLRHHIDGASIVGTITATLSTEREGGRGDPEPYRVMITAPSGDTRRLAALLALPGPRTGAALILMGEPPVPESTVIELTSGGRLHTAELALDLIAAGLTNDEAAACAAIVDLTRESMPTKIPVFAQAADDWQAFADHAGALREELTDARDMGPGDDNSLLPHSTEAYVTVAATTAADVETLAPVVPDQVRRKVEESDPTLNEDLAAWFDADCPLARLTLLGPVRATARGDLAAVAKRRPYFVELLAFLALHPEGVTARKVSDAFGIGQSRARTDIGFVRSWLGENPRTGRPHLPSGQASRVYEQTGSAGYQVDDLLVDLDLFRRLRARGQARGKDGIEDLVSALKLISGQPFDQLRENGWSWLLDDERLHETISCAVVDTSHTVVIHALANDDLGLARTAAETACRAAPYDEICRLDLIKVTEAEGHGDVAEKMLDRGVFDRTDDNQPPIDLPDRTKEVVSKQAWGRRGQPNNRV